VNEEEFKNGEKYESAWAGAGKGEERFEELPNW